MAKVTHQHFVFFSLFSILPLMFHAKEIELLLSFKSSINGDPSRFLSNWNYSSPNFCLWNGVSCNNSSTHVTSIDISGKNVSGKVSWDIFRLPFVESINLSVNQLYGGIPSNIFSASASLRHLNLSNNNFTGQVPVGGFVSGIQTLDLCSNMLSGKIPPEIGSFSSLKYIDLGGNMLVGEIPPSVSNITTLEFFTLASNQLVGRIPPEIGRMKYLKLIYMGYNNFSGEIPEEIGELSSLFHLDIVYNNLTGQIPALLGNLTHLRYLFLYQNKLSGPIPESVFGLKELISLDLSDNNLSGEIPEKIGELQSLEVLQLFSNNFEGKIPKGVASLARLQVLQLWSNRFSGEIPEDLGRRNALRILDLSTNNLTGRIPGGLCDSGQLFKLILFSNHLDGEIPKRLSACPSLLRVRLQNNRLSGRLSTEFTRLPLVYFLDISNNNLSGEIGDRRWEMTSLQMLNLAGNAFSGNLPETFGSEKLENLDLSENRFSGVIPENFGRFSELVQLNLRRNELIGEIPGQLCQCSKLVTLDLSQNKLSGEIPVRFAGMPVLSLLDLSANQLSGKIPSNLGSIEALVEVNVSHNHLRGSLPSTGVFLAINASSVAGNSLCGGHKTSGLPECQRKKINPFWWFFSACFLAALLVVGVAGFVIVIVRRQKGFATIKRVENEKGIWEFRFFDSNFSKSVAIEDVFQSITRGKIGNSPDGKSSSNGMQFVVKEMKGGTSASSNFWPEAAELGKIEHRNIVRLLGICHSEKNVYLMYENVEGRILGDIIRNLTWERRRKIAIGISRALKFLHFQSSPSVMVGDLSPENIIIDVNDEPRLRLAVPEHLNVDPKRFISEYVAPETREARQISEKSDIYALGLILIELLTGKSPGDAELGVHQTLVEWARYCYADCHLDSWVDSMIRNDAAYHHNQIVQIMNLALHCTAGDPSARPSAAEVSKTLETVLKISSFCISGLNFSSTPF